MGYWSSLHLIDIKIKASSLQTIRKAFKNRTHDLNDSLKVFFERGIVDRDGFLCFKGSKEGHDPYVKNEDDGTVPALYGKWDEAESIAAFIKQHSEKGGRIVLHSVEADGEAWGWEFDGKGGMRKLKLISVGKWK